ncbi:MAG TPA: carboxypeptidase regulatory-like domain-containing protein, partial [Thermoanaerobaculia bacterium]
MGRRLGFASSVFVYCLAALVALASSTRAQTTGSIAGWIADSSGSRLPGVTVEASSPRLQGIRVAVTGSDGSYRLPALPPGLYTVRASLPGFAGIEKAATVTLDTTSTVNMTLRLSLKEEVLVSGETSLVDTTSTTTGTNYSNKVIGHLPVDRNYAEIVRANPGVFTDRGDTQGRSLALSIYGATSAENQWIIDGVNTTHVEKGIQGKAINSEFIEEVEVKTGGYQAEYGRALGGVVNVITKSGGNTFHGDGFLYYDATPMRAQRVFTAQDSEASGMRLADYRRTDFGLDLGGFLIKDRLWFFAAYDRVEFPGKVSTVGDSNALVPSSMTFPLKGTDNLYSGKLTWNIARSSTLVATVFADPTENSGVGDADPRQGVANVGLITNPDPGTWKSSRFIGGTDYAVRFQQLVGSRGLATLQASRHQDHYWLKPSSRDVRLSDWTCDGGTPDKPCDWPAFENLDIGGFGFVYGPSDQTNSRRDQYRADWNLYLGAHDIKIGADHQSSRTTSGASF